MNRRNLLKRLVQGVVALTAIQTISLPAKSQTAAQSLQRQRSAALAAKFGTEAVTVVKLQLDSEALEQKLIEIYQRNSEFRKTLRDDLIG